MTKFTRAKNTGVRKFYVCDPQTQEWHVQAIIGKVSELLERNVIFADNTKGNEEKWLVILKDDVTSIKEFGTLEDAKAYCTSNYMSW